MRTLKFRAWDSKNKKFPFDGFHIIGECTVFDLVNQYRLEEFNDLVIQQFTGYKDRNGKDIYEGDIFRSNSQYKWGAVEFEDGKFQVLLKGARVFLLCELFEDGACPEVIGNIFETPELLP